MSKSKIFLRLFLLIVIFGPLTYFGYLNQGYFLQTASLHLSLNQPETLQFSYDTPAFNNAVYWIFSLLAGLFLAFTYSLPGKLRSQKQIKSLTSSNEALTEEVQRLTNALNESNTQQTEEALYETDTIEAVSEEATESSESEALNEHPPETEANEKPQA